MHIVTNTTVPNSEKKQGLYYQVKTFLCRQYLCCMLYRDYFVILICGVDGGVTLSILDSI